jgi:hypothetical protein
MSPNLLFNYCRSMINAFNNQPLCVAGWIIKLNAICGFILFSSISLPLCSPLHAQVCTSTLPSANYKRPYESGRGRNKLQSGGLVIITKCLKNDHSAGWGSTWRYHTAPPQIVILTDSKSKMEINPLKAGSNYKVQQKGL